MRQRLITYGSGELGGRVAKLWPEPGGAVIGLTATGKRHAALRAAGVEPMIGGPEKVLEPEDALLFALPGHAKQRQAVEALAGLPPPARAVLISSTGYYGLSAGTITEDTPPGADERSAAIAATEQAFFEWAGQNGVVIRFGGLYRPGRGPLPALLRRGHPLPGPPNKTLALIHYDDAATATVAALQHPAPESVYLGVVPPCPTREEFYRLACRRFDLDPPTFTKSLDHPPAQFDVARFRRDLLPAPAFPDWHEALEG